MKPSSLAIVTKRWILALSGVLIAAGVAVAVTLASPSAHAESLAAPACSPSTVVQTDNGPVCGTVVNGDTEWLGIPFAAAPTGNLRWEPPQPHASWSTTLQATAYGNSCPQAGEGTGSVADTNEDCLNLNVVKPSSAGPGPLPVMVWVYGGGFTSGSNSVYEPVNNLADAGHVIIVSVNYRVGVEGFLADKALGPHSGDYGLEDQQAGLAWVKHNIAAFGGDPHNVTIFGQSAGGSSMCDQIASPTAAGLFNKVISESGEYNSLLGAPTALQPQDCHATLPTEKQAQLSGETFAAGVGCGNASDVAACLRAVPVSTLLAAQAEGLGTQAPIINGTTLTMQLQKAFRTGQVNHVSAIMGVNRDENLSGTPTTAAQYQALVQAQYGPYASNVLARYPLERFASPFVAFRTVAADSDTVCPALRTDQRLSRWIPVHAYEDDDSDAPGFSGLSPTVPNGAFHGAELQFLFPGIAGSPVPLDADQQVLADQVTSEWTAFANTGNPTATGSLAWPQYRNPTGLVMSLQPAGDSQISTAQEISRVHNCAFWDSLSHN